MVKDEVKEEDDEEDQIGDLVERHNAVKHIREILEDELVDVQENREDAKLHAIADVLKGSLLRPGTQIRSHKAMPDEHKARALQAISDNVERYGDKDLDELVDGIATIYGASPS